MRLALRAQPGQARQRMLRASVGMCAAVGLVVSSISLSAAAASAESNPGLAAPSRDIASAASSAANEAAKVTELVVKYAPKVAAEQPDGLATGSAALGKPAEKGKRLDNGYRTVELPKPVSPNKATKLADKIEDDPRVLSAEPNYRVFAAVSPGPTVQPNDPLYVDQWDLASNGGLLTVEGNDVLGVNARYGWAGQPGGAAAPTIAVLDTGFSWHPDLEGRWVPGYDMVLDIERARDGDARDSDSTDEGDWNADPEMCSVRDSSWHGTHVAGTIGAIRDNAVGIAGLVSDAKIQAVRVLAQCGGSGADIADGITWAAGIKVRGLPVNQTPAKVINMSLGGTAGCPSYVQGAINDATSRGSVVVVAAGNTASDAEGFFPANCDGVVTVAALDPYGWRAGYSNYGATVDLAAPGGDAFFGSRAKIISTSNSGTEGQADPDYAPYQGTSMAAPHVAGAAALYLADHPDASPADVETALKDSSSTFLANDIWKNFRCIGARSCGAGALDIAALLEVETPPSGVVAASVGIYDPTRLGFVFGAPKGAVSDYTVMALSADDQVLGKSRITRTSGHVTVSDSGVVDRVVVTANNPIGEGFSQTVRISNYKPPAPVPTFAVAYDGNTSTGGTAQAEESSPFVEGATVTVVAKGSLVKLGPRLAGWNTAANGSGTAYVPAETFVMPGNAVTLYAQWTPTPTLTPSPTPTTELPVVPSESVIGKSTQQIDSLRKAIKLGETLRISNQTSAGLPLKVVSKKKRICTLREGKKRWKISTKRVGRCRLKLTAPATRKWERLKIRRVVSVK